MNQRLRRPPPKRRNLSNDAADLAPKATPEAEVRAPSEFRDKLRPWTRYLVLFAIAFAFFVASRVDAARPTLAVVVGLLFPAMAILTSVTAIRSRANPIAMAAYAVAAACLLASVGTLYFLFFPPRALGTQTLTESSSSFDVPVLHDGTAFTLQVRGKLQNENGVGEGEYVVEASRGGTTRTIEGRIYREIGQAQRAMSRSAPSRMVVTHEVDRTELQLPGRGPVHIVLKSITGGVHHALRVSVFSEATVVRYVGALGIAFLALAFLFELAFARMGSTIPFAAGIATAATFATYMSHQFDPDDALGTIGGGAIVAMLSGIVVYVVVKAIAKKLMPTE